MAFLAPYLASKYPTLDTASSDVTFARIAISKCLELGIGPTSAVPIALCMPILRGFAPKSNAKSVFGSTTALVADIVSSANLDEQDARRIVVQARQLAMVLSRFDGDAPWVSEYILKQYGAGVLEQTPLIQESNVDVSGRLPTWWWTNPSNLAMARALIGLAGAAASDQFDFGTTLRLALISRLICLKMHQRLGASSRILRLLAIQTLEVHASAADQIGVWKLKRELEDTAFDLIDSGSAIAIRATLAAAQLTHGHQISQAMGTIQAQLNGVGLDVYVQGRVKHTFSVYQKSLRLDQPVQDMNDILGVRVIVRESETPKLPPLARAVGAMVLSKQVGRRAIPRLQLVSPADLLHQAVLYSASPQPSAGEKSRANREDGRGAARAEREQTWRIDATLAEYVTDYTVAVRRAIPLQHDSSEKLLFVTDDGRPLGDEDIDSCIQRYRGAIQSDEAGCYVAFGVLASLWSPVPGVYGPRIWRNWIASPKPNGYQSIHTTLDYEGNQLEVQIRTDRMHRIAEYGHAAHWQYKARAGSAS